MNIKIIKDQISLEDVRVLAREIYTDMVKGVADVERGIIALGGEWHMDANVKLLAEGSAQKDVWGFNIYPDEKGDSVLRFVSLINIRPSQGSRSMEIEDKELRAKIQSIIEQRIPELFAK